MSNVFYKLKTENRLNEDQLDDIVNQAFNEIRAKYSQFILEYDEDGIAITNFENCTDEETGGWKKSEVEDNLTSELLDKAASYLLK